MSTRHLLRLAVMALVAGACSPSERAPQPMAMTTELPSQILTPDRVDTRLGPLEFFDGIPTETTTAVVYDNLDFTRGVRAFLDFIPVASLSAVRAGLREVGAVDGTVGIFEQLMDSKSLFLTANTESVYAMTWLDLSDGPVVVESPPNVLGIVDNFWFEYVADLGNAGPDRGQGGRFLFVPPGWEGDLPDGYFTYQSSTYGNVLIWRGFLVDGDPAPAVANMKSRIHVYPLSQAADPPEQEFLNLSGRAFNTIHANDFDFFAEVDEVIQEEPSEGLDPELLGTLASIGIEKGQPFAPDARMREILTDAVAVGNALARTVSFMSDDPAVKIYDDRRWTNALLTGGGYLFEIDGVRLLDARTMFFYMATMTTPAMALQMVGVGSQYAAAFVDSEGRYLDGGRTYRLHLPPDAPARDFWSVVLYDNQTRSMLQTDQQFPSLNSERGVQQNPDGSTDLYFGPNPPEGMEGNWVQTIPGKGFFPILRLYGPLEPWFDRTWRPDDLERMENIPPVAPSGDRPRMATDIPAWITTPDRVETRIGTLEFFDGFPTAETIELVRENLLFMRGVETFLNAIPMASVRAAREGQKEAFGLTRNGVVGITETLLDSRSLFLTANTESVYILSWLDLSDGPVVVESPPNTLGMVDDMYFRYVADLGNAGPDRGQGGNFLFLPPDWEGDVPEGYFVYRSRTVSNAIFWRGFLTDGDPGPAVASAREVLKIYPLDRPADRDRMEFVNASGMYFNTIHANDITFFDEVQEVVDQEPASAFSPELLGLLAATGIEKGAPFAPDGSTRATMIEAAAVGNATARALSFRRRDPRAYYYEGSGWHTAFVGGDYQFLRQSGARDLDARTGFHYPYTGVTPAMAIQMVGIGSQYAITALDAEGEVLDGSHSYRLILPGPIPANDFWSMVAYDPQSRSMLQTDQQFPSLSSQVPGVVATPDGSYVIYFGPEAPSGMESNWIQTVPGKAFFPILRLYGPLEPWFDRSWRPGELERID